MAGKKKAPPWKKKPYPGAPKPAFKITNQWANALLDWEARVRAMCLIVQAELGVSDPAFAAVMKAIANNQHSPRNVKKILASYKYPAKKNQPVPASDVVGHPPDPPFDGSSL